MLRSLIALLIVCSSSFAYDIPRLANITIDGDAADWKDGGFKLNVLTPVARAVSGSDLDASVRVAWNDEHLYLFIRTSDNVSDISERDDQLWQRDSVELFFADAVGGKVLTQYVVARGETGGGLMGFKSIDRRPTGPNNPNPADNAPPAFQVARKDRRGGTDLEIALPWKNIGLSPRPGATCALQIYINDTDRDASGRKQLAWFPATNTHQSTKSMHAITLAEKPSEPIDLAVHVGHDDFRRMVINGAFRGDLSKTPRGGIMRVVDPNAPVPEMAELGRAQVMASDELGVASLRLLMPSLHSNRRDLDVVMAGQTVRVRVPDWNEQRLNAFDRLKLKPQTYVFSSDSFPAIDFASVDRAENLVDRYAISTRFFDANMEEVTKPAAPGRYGAVVTIKVAGFPDRMRYITLCRIAGEVDRYEWKPQVDLGLAELLKLDDPVAERERDDITDAAKDAFLAGLSESESQAKLIAGLFDKVEPGQSQNAFDRDQAWWFALRKKIGQPLEYAYIDWVPKIPAGEKRPLILFLHGSGERGNDLSKLENFGPRVFGKRHPDDFPFIVISPQCPIGEWWNPLAVKELLDKVMQKYPVDPDRVYLTGLSMGAFGSWKVGPMYADQFAAIVPICGGGDPRDMDAITNIPTWVFHGGEDRVVKPVMSYRLVEALRKQNGRVRYTLYPTADHDSWTATYNDPRLYEWLLQQRRGAPAEPTFQGEPTTQPTEIR
jgi:predicted esterase